jgi:hypothetical protein
LRIFKIVKYVRLLRMVRFLKVNKFIQKIEELFVSETSNIVLRFIKLMITVVFISHWIACLFYGVGSYMQDETGNSWAATEDIYDANLFKKYVNSMYLALTTMTTCGYGDFHPSSS